jgi:translation initiation factor 2 subunit 3
LAALTALGVNNIVIVQNKIDLISRDEAMTNYQQIKEFVKGTIAEDAPVVPMSAMHGANLDILLSALQKFIPDPDRDLEAPMRMHVARSFDINRPGTDPKRIRGGVLGGSIYQGKMNIDDEIVILPGLKKKEGKKTIFKPVKTRVKSINLGTFGRSKTATPGGLMGIQTTIDPSMARSDSLAGSIIAAYKEGEELPPVVSRLELSVNLFENVVGSEEHLTVKPLIKNEKLLLTIGTATAVCNVSEILKKGKINVDVNPHIAIMPETKIAISRNFNKRWRLIGWAEIVDYSEVEITIIA